MKRIARLAIASSILAPAAAFACGGPGSASYGAAVLRSADTASYVVNRDAGVEWASLTAPFQDRTVIAQYDPAKVAAADGWSSVAPVMKLSPDGARQILWVPIPTWSTATSSGIYDLRADSALEVVIPGSMQVTGFDAVFDASSAPLILASTDSGLLHLLTRATDSFDSFDGFKEVARGDANGCAATALALLPDADGFLGLCGDRPLTLAGDQILVGDSLLGANPVAVAGIRAAGSEVFFAATPSLDGLSVSIDRLSRNGGAWVVDHATGLPLASLSDDETIAVASPGAVAVLGSRSDNYETALYVVRDDGAGWSAEPAGRADASDRVSAIDDGESITVLTGSIEMRLHTRTHGLWTTRNLGRIGHETSFGGCSIAAVDAIPAIGPALLGLASVLAFALRRRD